MTRYGGEQLFSDNWLLLTQQSYIMCPGEILEGYKSPELYPVSTRLYETTHLVTKLHHEEKKLVVMLSLY